MKLTLSRSFALATTLILVGVAVVWAIPGDTPTPDAPKVAEASDEGELAIAGFKKPAGSEVRLFAAEPDVANPVAFYVDDAGKVWVCETFRQKKGVEDNRSHSNWVDDDLAAQTLEDRAAYFEKHLGEKLGEYTKHDDRIRLLVDENGDGKADKTTVFADGFNSILHGTGAGVLEYNDKVFYTCIPDLYLLSDEDNDGQADQRKSLHTGFGIRVAFRGHDMHGLTLGPDGRVYFSIGDRGFNVKANGRQYVNPNSGAVFRCELDGSNFEVVATGLRNPQELAFDE
ncbi:MAG: glucose dehydrogenase, partial [bacterium]|nr:glucose dehydrogenase [bacterium]